MNLLRAKRAVEAMVRDGNAFVHVPKIKSLNAPLQELADTG